MAKGTGDAAIRKEIIDVVIALIAERGPEGFSISDIARRTGRARSLPHHYFSNKAELVRAAVLELKSQVSDQPFASSLAEFATKLQGFVTDENPSVRRRAIQALLGEVAQGSSYRLEAGNIYAAMFRAIRSSLQAVQARKELREGLDLDVEAFGALALVRGATFMGLTPTPGLDHRSLARKAVAALIERTKREDPTTSRPVSAPVVDAVEEDEDEDQDEVELTEEDRLLAKNHLIQEIRRRQAEEPE